MNLIVDFLDELLLQYCARIRFISSAYPTQFIITSLQPNLNTPDFSSMNIGYPSIKQLNKRALLNYIPIVSVQLTYMPYTLSYGEIVADVLTPHVFQATTQRRCVVFHFSFRNTQSAKFFNCNFFLIVSAYLNCARCILDEYLFH